MTYIDHRGWRYLVMQGLGTPPVFKARYNKPCSKTWRCVRTLPWRKTEEEAEKDLAGYAAKHKMKELEM